VTDPRRWTATDSVSNGLSHLAYGAVTAAVLHALDRPRGVRTGTG
jgi:hypothetical protein